MKRGHGVRFLLVTFLLASLASRPNAYGRMVERPDGNRLWVEDFGPVEIDETAESGWRHFDEIAVEQLEDRVRLRQVGPRAEGRLQRNVPYDLREGEGFPYLQVRLGGVENPDHFLALAGMAPGAPALGRPHTGVTTYDLRGQALHLNALAGRFPLTLVQRGNRGPDPGGWLDLEEIRMVRLPEDGLTLDLRKRTGAPEDRARVAEVGDRIVFRYHSGERLPVEDLRVRLYVGPNMIPYRLSAESEIELAYREGGYEAEAEITGEALHLAPDMELDLLATLSVDTEDRHARPAFGFDVRTPHRMDAVLAASTPTARDARMQWMEASLGRWLDPDHNLALGRSVRFSLEPNYRLTRDENDALDLTSGRLASRTDDRIWFARDAVGWGSGADSGVNLLLDLGAVQPVDRVVIRLLGGGEQRSLLFPRHLSLVVSDDGEVFHRVATLDKLMPGEKDQAHMEGVYYLPEPGRAYVHPFVFADLQTRARYVGIALTGASAFVFADELAVLRGNHAAENVVFAPEDRVDFIMEGMLIRPYHGKLAVSDNIATPHRFEVVDMRAEADRKDPYTVVMELPEGIAPRADVLREGWSHSEVAERRAGLRYTRWSGPGVPLYFEAKAEADRARGAAAFLSIEAEGYAPNVIEVPVDIVTIPEVPALQRLHVSLAWMTEGTPLGWPDFFDAWRHLGFNVVSTFPRYWRDGVPRDEVAAWLAEARARDFKILYNESPFHVMVNRCRRNRPEIFSQLPGGPSSNACPSYRGECYEAEIRRVGDLFEAVRPDYIFHDIELWYRGAREAERCERCRARRREGGKEMSEFLTDMGREMIRDMTAEVRRRSESGGIPMPVVAVYDLHAARPVYHLVFDFFKLYPEVMDLAQPSLYLRGDAVATRDSIRENYRRIGRRDILPWLTAGTYGEFPPYRIEPIILESFLNGALGITYYRIQDFDSAWDWYYHARALALLAPHEDLLVRGGPMHDRLAWTNDRLFYSAWGTDEELLLLVGNYHRSPETESVITLPYPRVGRIREEREGVDVEGGRTLATRVPPGEIRLYHVRADR